MRQAWLESSQRCSKTKNIPCMNGEISVSCSIIALLNVAVSFLPILLAPESPPRQPRRYSGHPVDTPDQKSQQIRNPGLVLRVGSTNPVIRGIRPEGS